jgi:endogenous inhibitor of DNA gyrase (YacG/DUF329 family)
MKTEKPTRPCNYCHKPYTLPKMNAHLSCYCSLRCRLAQFGVNNPRVPKKEVEVLKRIKERKYESLEAILHDLMA